LSIAGRLHSSKLEYEFYKTNIVNFDDWEFLPKINDRKSYNAVDESQYIIGIDSTLLYESFSRGKKTAFFTCRGEIFGENVGRFAWPNELRDTGPFWSNSINKNEFNRVMDYIINVHSDEWMRVCLQYNENVMDYDSGNKKLISLFKNIGLPINKKYV
jgi:surface carbohydrate biosynthesis protein